MAELVIVVLAAVLSFYSTKEESCYEAPAYVSTEVGEVVQEGDVRPSP